jgi:Lrp/AsnC family transcriptional regulator, cysteine-sensing transcriptional activator
MDAIDLRILRALQDDSGQPVSEVAKQVGLSASPCWKRINRLEQEGLIRRRTAILDPERLGFGLVVFVGIRTGEHSGEWLRAFAERVSAMPEVLEFHRMAGEVDYLLKVVVPDMRAYDAFYKRLIEATPLTEVTSRFSMETIKATTALPI